MTPVNKLAQRITMMENVVKFFQSYITGLADMGGLNFPKSVSSLMGAKLRKLYAKKGITGVEEALTSMFEGIGGNVLFKHLSDGDYVVTVDYPQQFCPIGGKDNPKRQQVFNEFICRPYSEGFLRGLDKDSAAKIEVEECLLQENAQYCRMKIKFSK